jgi:hypothetical protein
MKPQSERTPAWALGASRGVRGRRHWDERVARRAAPRAHPQAASSVATTRLAHAETWRPRPLATRRAVETVAAAREASCSGAARASCSCVRTARCRDATWRTRLRSSHGRPGAAPRPHAGAPIDPRLTRQSRAGLHYSSDLERRCPDNHSSLCFRARWTRRFGSSVRRWLIKRSENAKLVQELRQFEHDIIDEISLTKRDILPISGRHDFRRGGKPSTGSRTWRRREPGEVTSDRSAALTRCCRGVGEPSPNSPVRCLRLHRADSRPW